VKLGLKAKHFAAIVAIIFVALGLSCFVMSGALGITSNIYKNSYLAQLGLFSAFLLIAIIAAVAVLTTATHFFTKNMEKSSRALTDNLEKELGELVKERDRFEAVLEGMNDAVLTLDKDRRVSMINRAGIMLLSMGEQPIGKALLEMIRVPDLDLLLSRVSSNEASSLEFDLTEAVARRVLATASKLTSGDYVVVLQDVTELRRLETLRRDFVSNVSHELKTPISIISANAETLLGGAMDDREDAVRFLGSMVKNTARLTNLVSDLLDISRIEEGRFDIDKEHIPVVQSLRRAAAALETRAIEKDISLRVESGTDMEIIADARALDQVLSNLLDNAVKYTDNNGHVILRAAPDGQWIKIEIEDDGPGIEPGHRERLFERFFRVDKGRSREMGGTGLGLAIAKHLTNAMEGEIGMIPAKNRGSCFWLRLPKSKQ